MTKKVWKISPYYNSKNHDLKLELTYESDQVYRFRVSGKNRSIVIQCDIPLLKAMNSKKRVDWKLIEGVMYNAELFTAIINEIKYIIDNDGKKPYTYLDHPKNK